MHSELDLPTLARLRALLSDIEIAPGNRLPPERELSRMLGVSRSELRKALVVLEFEGVLKRHVGRGTYLCETNISETRAKSRSNIASVAERTSPHDAMMARIALEPRLAGFAAVHATRRQLADARSLATAMRAAETWEEYERLDAEFHQAIADAAGNALLSELHRIVNQVRISVVWPSLSLPKDGPPEGYHSFLEHDAILDALERRDRDGAQAAMQAHLKSTRATLIPED